MLLSFFNLFNYTFKEVFQLFILFTPPFFISLRSHFKNIHGRLPIFFLIVLQRLLSDYCVILPPLFGFSIQRREHSHLLLLLQMCF
mmetsp:Transcript_32891/g.32107  ORF Transcript_32891/g.32107 Transcript_32891/m.32107 type:complete len:86 (+) Transcript_32891:144-401(+)